MNQKIIDLYKINFQNQIEDSKFHGRQIDKFPFTNDSILTTFLYDWSAREINEYLISDIDDVLNNSVPNAQNGSETITIVINPQNTIFYIDNVGTNYPKIPTKDFREIVIGWRDFLLTPPLNGTKV